MKNEENTVTSDVSDQSDQITMQIVYDELEKHAKNRDLFDVYDHTALGLNNGTIFEGYFRTLICFLIQTLAPVWVLYHSIPDILKDEPGDIIEDEPGEANPKMLCPGMFNKDTNISDVFSKVVATCFVLYLTIYINKELVRLKNKPTYRMFVLGKRFEVLTCYRWAIVGLITNFFASIVCLIAGLAIILKQNSTDGIILNALAIFFIIDVDNNVLTYDEAKALDFTDASSVPYKYGKFLKLLSKCCFAFLYFFFATGPVYIFFCKEGLSSGTS